MKLFRYKCSLSCLDLTSKAPKGALNQECLGSSNGDGTLLAWCSTVLSSQTGVRPAACSASVNRVWLRNARVRNSGAGTALTSQCGPRMKGSSRSASRDCGVPLVEIGRAELRRHVQLQAGQSTETRQPNTQPVLFPFRLFQRRASLDCRCSDFLGFVSNHWLQQ